MIGSRRRTATVLQHLAEEGADVGALEAMSTPVGLDIGAETPEEIALSILSEMTAVRHGVQVPETIEPPKVNLEAGCAVPTQSS